MTLCCNNKESFVRKPRAVLCDADNTLYAYQPAHEQALRAVVEKAKQGLGFDEKVFLDAFAEARKAIKARHGGTASSHNRLLYMQQTLELLGLKSQIYLAMDLEQTYWRTFMASAVLFPGAKEFLQSLRRAGIATCVVTDLAAHIQFRKLVYFGLNDYFDFVVTSEEAGTEKPAAAPFEIALRKLGVTPGEAVMIGDDAAKDIAGARSLGIAVAQKRHPGVEVFTDAGRQPDMVFDHFSELEHYFAGRRWLDAVLSSLAAHKA